MSAWVNRLLQIVCRSELEWLFVTILYWKISVRSEEITACVELQWKLQEVMQFVVSMAVVKLFSDEGPLITEETV